MGGQDRAVVDHWQDSAMVQIVQWLISGGGSGMVDQWLR